MLSLHDVILNNYIAGQNVRVSHPLLYNFIGVFEIAINFYEFLPNFEQFLQGSEGCGMFCTIFMFMEVPT